MSDILLEAHQVTQYYGDGKDKILVLQDVSLDIRRDEVIAILGPSGSGKSTLLRIMAGLLNASQGEVRFQGQVQCGCNPHVAIVFQTFALFPWLTVYQNVELGLLNKTEPPADRRRRIIEAIDVIGLDGFEEAYPKELSGGMRQRVGFARALVVEPMILFMDEPFSALDVLTAENLKKELLSLWRNKKIPTQAILMVTHNIAEAVTMGDRIIVMGHNPGVVRIDMPGLPVEQREKDHAEHVRLVDYLYGVMTHPQDAALAFTSQLPAVRPSRAPSRAYQVLPHVAVGAMTGLIEHLHASGDRVDIPVLGEDLHMEVDDLLPLLQAIDMLGLGDIESGDAYLTPLGIEYAGADIQGRKQIFSRQARTIIQLIRQILTGLEAQRKVRWDDLRDSLEGCFSQNEAERQLDTAIAWGRYAELFAYDDEEGAFYLETPEAAI
ncbi:MAG TPA: nitrate/sulfonate/bicarbonate ABC transporter ATP-binding protein [Candidatus Xenobia bacterium]|jgi:NitT/TauT family transport system ATP-binding protein